MNIKAGALRRLMRAEIFSPGGFLVRAAMIGFAFAICHAAGLREYTTFLSGTSATGRFEWSIVFGVTYMFAYFGFVLGVPILLLASAILSIILRNPSNRRLSS